MLAVMNQPAENITPATRRLYLIDGYGFVFRAFHAIRELTAPDGTPVNAVYGFTNMLLKLRRNVRENNGDYMVVVFDAGKKSFRNTIYADYKANRPPAPPELIPQFALVREAAAAIGLPCVELEGYEADDLIATYAREACRQGIEVIVVSSDKDLMQLVCDGIQLYDAMKDKPIGLPEVFEKFGVTPEKVLDVLALMGDSSDNIPGVPGIGPKTAAELVNQFGSLDDILAGAAQVKQQKRRESLQQFAEQARLSRELARLKEDAPMPATIESFTVREEHPEVVLPFLQRMGFKSLTAKFEEKHRVKSSAFNVQSSESGVQSSEKQQTEYVTLEGGQLAAWLEPARDSGKLAIVPTAEGMAVATAPGRAAYVPFGAGKPQTDLFGGGEVKDDRQVIRDALEPYVKDASVLKVGHDMKQGTKTETLLPAPYDDTLMMSYVLDGARYSHDLANLAQMQTGMVLADDDHAAKADAVLRLQAHFRKRLFNEKMLSLYENMERPLVQVLAAMEARGIKVDSARLKELSQTFHKEIASLEKEIHALAGREFLIASPKQLGEVLFDEMKLPGGKVSKKSGAYGTDVSVLEELVEQGHVIAAKVLAWRGLTKLTTTYTEALQKEINPKTGRVHTTFAMAATTTGRLSSVNPNLQNIPVRTPEGKSIRTAFIASSGNLLISADYSQIELRLLAHMADIPALKEAFRNEEDIHAKTAAQVFGIPLAEVDGSHRRAAKAINFGIIYGQSAFGLAAGLGIPQAQAKQYIESYFRQYPGIRDYMEKTKLEAREQGYVTTLFGRKCFLPGINAGGPQRAFAERAAINAPLQGTAADIIKKAMVAIHRKLPEKGFSARMVLQVHDELLIEAPEAEVQDVMALVKREMEQVATLSVPLTASANAGKDWGGIH